MQDKVTILIVDDTAANLTAMQALLDDPEYNLVMAQSATEALAYLLKNEAPALILLDVQMPEMDGFELAQLIRARELTRHTPIIFITAYNKSDEEITKGYYIGAVDYLFKPVIPEILKAKVSVFVELHRKSAAYMREQELRHLAETFKQATEESLHRLARYNETLEWQNLNLSTMNTQLQQEQQELEEAQAELAAINEHLRVARLREQEANRHKDRFLAMVSHELRTPLTAIAGWVRLLKSGKLDAESAARALDTIERNVQTQTRLIEDLLDISRIIGGKMQLECRTLDLKAIVSDVIDMMMPSAAAKQIQFDAHLDATEVSGDADRLQQVVWNLLSNAIKFTPEGGRVAVSLAHNGAHAELLVSDTGKGIAPDFLPFVFDQFRQADSTVTRRHGGLGLGLAIARHIIELHGGSISAYSEGEGQGASFKLTLPCHKLQTQHASI